MTPSVVHRCQKSLIVYPLISSRAQGQLVVRVWRHHHQLQPYDHRHCCALRQQLLRRQQQYQWGNKGWKEVKITADAYMSTNL